MAFHSLADIEFLGHIFMFAYYITPIVSLSYLSFIFMFLVHYAVISFQSYFSIIIFYIIIFLVFSLVFKSLLVSGFRHFHYFHFFSSPPIFASGLSLLSRCISSSASGFAIFALAFAGHSSPLSSRRRHFQGQPVFRFPCLLAPFFLPLISCLVHLLLPAGCFSFSHFRQPFSAYSLRH